ncbi:MAG: hypothetical protein ACPGO5_00895 [Patescibacteria group bacterium]
MYSFSLRARQALLNTFGVVVYSFVAAVILRSASDLMVGLPEIVNITILLMLFVLSVSIVGWLIVGRPLLLYIDGKKKDALQLFQFTLMWLILFTGIGFLVAASL